MTNPTPPGVDEKDTLAAFSADFSAKACAAIQQRIDDGKQEPREGALMIALWQEIAGDWAYAINPVGERTSEYHSSGKIYVIRRALSKASAQRDTVRRSEEQTGLGRLEMLCKLLDCLLWWQQQRLNHVLCGRMTAAGRTRRAIAQLEAA